ncbi:hypothetical protein HHL16_08235 [Pseudoflavitalea sp. G-6-1-2]|uniref:metallophosphoesterase family protein n=1 Tax=Pseudoflavitalea sp. G-6-1-2 TaxID=2728841 RepID=UPI00146F5677|nr:metallophosphoesterase [Pseudoflavitalea sp. G-6-1-2]NML20859.1 hypothetical protein [Pseudoflavitalea sp. G-6-1-2]
MDPELSKRVAELKQHTSIDASLKSEIQQLMNFLPYCEYDLICFMVSKNVWQGYIPDPPEGWSQGSGSVELGLMLYWLKNPTQLDLSVFTFWEGLEIEALLLVLDEYLPRSNITSINAEFFNHKELIYTDGTVLSTEKWCVFDQGWFTAFLNLLETLFRKLWYSGNDFPATKPPVIPLSNHTASSNNISIAIIGDCGTGDATMQAIINNVLHQQPDYIVHVGDVYYAGTPKSDTVNGQYYFGPGEEANNLLNLWPSNYAGRSFTLNSNHEMYSGANGYFYDALDAANKGASSYFNAQKGSSCFALTCGDWTILGLDTAYMATSIDAFMTGSIGGSEGTQGRWIKSLAPDPSKTIVLTHHNGFAADCSALSTLWSEISGALDGDPYAWYWGHVHNGIVYDAPISIPAGNSQQAFTTNTFARCLGHAAMPYGLSPALRNKPITWNQTNQQPSPSLQLYNGFALIRITQNGKQISSIEESYYDLSSVDAIYSKTIYTAE